MSKLTREDLVVTTTEEELELIICGRLIFAFGLLSSISSGRPNFVARCLARFWWMAQKDGTCYGTAIRAYNVLYDTTR